MDVRLLTLLVIAAFLAIVSADNPCCSYPCQHGGICMTTGFDSYICDCTRLGYEGDYCENIMPGDMGPTSRSRSSSVFQILHGVFSGFKTFWNMVNNMPLAHATVSKYVLLDCYSLIANPPLYNTYHDYVTLEVTKDNTLYARVLPPVPQNCPRPMGDKGPETLPDAQYMFDTLFKRSEFIPEETGLNQLFAMHAQHFTHQIFWSDKEKGVGYNKGSQMYDGSNVYGNTKDIENTLRSHLDGKMKTQMIDGEDYPPYLRDAPVPMRYHENVTEDMKFGLGHELFGKIPTMFVCSTLWIREHNRVCDILKSEHPEFDDERLFQTARLIIIGEIAKISLEDYFQALSNVHLKFSLEPELLFEEQIQYRPYIHLEFNVMYRWHQLVPDEYYISGETIPVKDFFFNTELVFRFGLSNFIDSLSRQSAGKVTHHNHASVTQEVVKSSIQLGRDARLQSLNQYRKKFGLEPFSSFQDLTGDEELAKKVEAMYGDIDAVEFYPGIFLEKPTPNQPLPVTMGRSMLGFGIPTLMSNPLFSPNHWKPSTFGGQTGFDLVRNASITRLVCQNIKGTCPLVSFKIPSANS